MTLYLFIKFIHILSSTILFGTGIGTAAVMVYAHHSKNIIVLAAVTRYVVLADWIFTTTSGIIQPLTGFWLIHLGHYSMMSFWVMASTILYCIAAVCWFIVVYLQIKMRDFVQYSLQTNTPLPSKYFQYYKLWFLLGWPAFIGLLIIFYLMTHKIS